MTTTDKGTIASTTESTETAPARPASALRRRGLVAGAAALAAALIARQSSDPVLAADGGNIIIGRSVANDQNNQFTTTTTLTNPALTAGVTSPGTGTVPSNSGTPTAGFRVFKSYPYGTSGTVIDATADAIQGFGATANTSGVHGRNDDLNGIGTTGVASNGTGVYGQSTSGTAVGGSSSSGAGIYGVTNMNYGLYGVANTGIGCFGQTSGTGSYGVLGTTTAGNSIALGGIANADGSSCFSGGTANPNAYAAFFQGHVQVVSGAFDVFPMGNKHGLALHPDGTHRTFYSVESPECWVEDFGEGTVTAGKAAVKLDADFATLVHTDTYHVFLTEHGGHNGLHTTSKTASEFVVEADGALATAKGKSATQVSSTFSWRVVAKPKTTANVDRFAKSKVGNFPLPDIAKLPKPPGANALPKRKP